MTTDLAVSWHSEIKIAMTKKVLGGGAQTICTTIAKGVDNGQGVWVSGRFRDFFVEVLQITKTREAVTGGVLK